jgi:hypothetical protein
MDTGGAHEGFGMRLSSVLLPGTTAAIVTLLALALNSVALAPGSPQDGGNEGPDNFPAPTNLKVLPREMTGHQVHQLMEQWQTALGVRCDSCHAEDPENSSPDGGVLLNFADDSKPMKRVARQMYQMTEEINTKYIAPIEGSGLGVTCGTCHRGHLGPEPFLIPPDGGRSTDNRPPPKYENRACIFNHLPLSSISTASLVVLKGTHAPIFSALQSECN